MYRQPQTCIILCVVWCGVVWCGVVCVCVCVCVCVVWCGVVWCVCVCVVWCGVCVCVCVCVVWCGVCVCVCVCVCGVRMRVWRASVCECARGCVFVCAGRRMCRSGRWGGGGGGSYIRVFVCVGDGWDTSKFLRRIFYSQAEPQRFRFKSLSLLSVGLSRLGKETWRLGWVGVPT